MNYICYGYSIKKNDTASVSINCHTKKVRYEIDCYILHTVLAIILLLIITVICYYCAKHRSKLKSVNAMTKMENNLKMENSEFKRAHIKNPTWYYFDDIIKLN